MIIRSSLRIIDDVSLLFIMSQNIHGLFCIVISTYIPKVVINASVRNYLLPKQCHTLIARLMYVRISGGIDSLWHLTGMGVQICF